MYQLLFVDDDRNLLRVNRAYFSALHFEVFTAENESEMLSILNKQIIDCIILDIMLPGTDGYELCRKIKKQMAVPIIFLTSMPDDNSLYRGFAEGGDDYLTKPYNPRELELRVRARINEHKGISLRGDLLEFPPFEIDVTARQARADGHPLPLTANEFDILLLLTRSPGIPFSAVEIFREIWKLPDLETVNTVRVHIGNLRRKLEQACPGSAFIQTEWGKGYFIAKEKEKTG